MPKGKSPYLEYFLKQDELIELRKLWFEECWTQKDIAEWFGIPVHNIHTYIVSFIVEKNEFQEKKAEIAEFLKVFGRRKPLELLAKKRLKRLEEAYDRSRNCK